MLDVPAQKHGVVLVLGIVAMFHVGSGEFPEPDGHLDAVGAVSLGADPIDILAGPFFPFRRLFSTPFEDYAFLEVDVDRVAPAVLAQDTPDFQSPFPAGACLCRTVGELWRRR